MNTNLETENLIGPDRVMDVRPIPCSIKHGLIIRTWTDLAVGVTLPYVKLQITNPPAETQQQAARVSRAFQLGSLVAGGVSDSLAGTGYYCGDGLCSAQVDEDVSSCAADCGNPPPPGSGAAGGSSGGGFGGSTCVETECDPGIVRPRP